MRRDRIKNTFTSAKVVEILSIKAILVFLFGFSFDHTVSKMSEVQNIDLSKLSDAEAKDLIKKLSEKLEGGDGGHRQDHVDEMFPRRGGYGDGGGGEGGGGGDGGGGGGGDGGGGGGGGDGGGGC